MRQLRVTDEARADLTENWLYVAQDNEDAANALTDRIVKTFEQLLIVPGMGRERNDIAPGLRSFPVGRYLIFYRFIDEGLEIVRVLHGARDLESLL